MKDSITCPNCQKTSHNPNDIRFGWCTVCDQFTWAIGNPPIDLNLIVAEFQKPVRYNLNQGAPFSLQFEQFMGEDGTMKWRALVKMAQHVWRHSTREHENPTDALHELSEIVEARS